MDLNVLWFVLLGLLLTGYAVLDGFDLGVGILHLGARGDRERRILMNSIGPLWDGNEVWLIVFGGALFAAFPHAYATAFSAFYLPFTLLLFALIFRAVSLEFRGKRESGAWRGLFDACFFAGSALAALLFGVAVGNVMRGIPIDASKEFAGTVLDLLRPYPLLTGVFALALFAMHGALYLYLKTEGELQERVRRWTWRAFGVFVALYVLTTIISLTTMPSATRNFGQFPWAWAVVAVNVALIANIAWSVARQRPFAAFLSSCGTIVALVFLFMIGLYPNLIIASDNPAWNLTIYSASSSFKTLWVMTIIALIGMPLVLTYTVVIYWVFRGKVRLSETSY
jgi:cytochrome d ubiquinol oxidase subunit II